MDHIPRVRVMVNMVDMVFYLTRKIICPPETVERPCRPCDHGGGMVLILWSNVQSFAQTRSKEQILTLAFASFR
jgi:hypothetical protein